MALYDEDIRDYPCEPAWHHLIYLPCHCRNTKCWTSIWNKILQLSFAILLLLCDIKFGQLTASEARTKEQSVVFQSLFWSNIFFALSCILIASLTFLSRGSFLHMCERGRLRARLFHLYHMVFFAFYVFYALVIFFRAYVQSYHGFWFGGVVALAEASLMLAGKDDVQIPRRVSIDEGN